MKQIKFIALFLMLAVLIASCKYDNEATIPTESSGNKEKEKIEQRCIEISSMYYNLYMLAEKTEPQNTWDEPILSQASVDAIENLLREKGIDVMDTSAECPPYLTTSERFLDFWNHAKYGEPAEQEVISISQSGVLSYQLFSSSENGPLLYYMRYGFDGEPYYEKHQILDWEITEMKNFYYRIYPAGDKHYDDYSMIRLTKPDLELQNLNTKYILAGGYLATNLFLINWTENDYKNLSFNDLWEYIYRDHYGTTFDPHDYNYSADQTCYEIPASEFEKVILSYFKIDIETLRKLAHYNENGDFYPWRQVQTNDFEFLNYYSIESNVTAYQHNSDGTITLTVEMLSTDLKTDCLFSHEVTIRPLANGKFQFTGNTVTYQTEYGLPFCEPRISWKR